MAGAQSPKVRLLTEYTGAPRDALSLGRGQGVMVFTWDDGYPEWTDVQSLATSLGQRHTFCVTSDRIDAVGGVTSSFISTAFSNGHEIAAHSKTHTKINSSMAAATRLTEYETPRTAIEAIIGAGNVKTWVWPYGTASSPAGRDATVDQEIYTRYDRQLDTMGGLGLPVRIGDRPRFNIARYSWSPDSGGNTEIIREMVKVAAKSPVIFPIYSHNFTDPGSGLTNVQSILNLCNSLGVLCLTAQEAFPGEPFYLPDPSFENTTSLTWSYTGDGNTTGTFGSSPVGLDTNIYGSQVGTLTSSVTTSTPFFYSEFPAEVGINYTVSGRYYLTASTGGASPKLYVGIQFYDAYGATVGSSNDSATLHGTVGSWARFSYAVTVPATAVKGRIKLVMQQLQATVYWDHVHIGPTDYGSYG